MSLRRIALSLIGLLVLFVLVAAPLAGWPPVVRLPAVLAPAIVLALLVMKPWHSKDLGQFVIDWQPARRVILVTAGIVGCVLFWYVMTRFRSGEINAVDFTVYFDRPCFQTTQGRPLFVEASDTPGYSQRSELADHAYWAMLPICSVYAITPSPYWLHALSVLAIVAGAFLILRILQETGAGGVLACATAFAFILNDNTSRAMNYGFHPEVLYACSIPWMILAGLRGQRRSFLLAVLATVLIKEDALLPIFAATVALAFARFRKMSREERGLFLVLPNVLAFANLAVFYSYVVPMLTGKSVPTYQHFWANFGATPTQVVVGMLSDPSRVLTGVIASGIIKVVMPHLFLPVVGWRWTMGLLPLIALYGASANEQVRGFGIYYALVLVPFLIIGASVGALNVVRRFVRHEGHAQLVAACLVLGGALFVGGGHRGYSVRPWRISTSGVREALTRLPDERTVLIQSGLFPHAGYSEQAVLLTPETLRDPRNADATVLIAIRLSPYPYLRPDLLPLATLPRVAEMPAGIIALRAGDVLKRLHPKDPLM
ncbi:MAG: DUF2079 domain-containing protein [Vicinamibacteria bacterium]